jgi:catechol 2,3-dioxygenase-like lactoylglutathione lyase family enzyme
MAPFAVQRIDHLVLRVRDLQRSVAFYESAIGCTVVRWRDDLGLVHLRAGASMIDLISIDGELQGAKAVRRKPVAAISIRACASSPLMSRWSSLTSQHRRRASRQGVGKFQRRGGSVTLLRGHRRQCG